MRTWTVSSCVPDTEGEVLWRGLADDERDAYDRYVDTDRARGFATCSYGEVNVDIAGRG